MSHEKSSGDGCTQILLILILLTLWGFFNEPPEPQPKPDCDAARSAVTGVAINIK